MFDDQDGCEWVNVSSGLPGQRSVKRLCVCVTVLTLFKKMVNITLDKWPKGCVAVVTEKKRNTFSVVVPHIYSTFRPSLFKFGEL